MSDDDEKELRGISRLAWMLKNLHTAEEFVFYDYLKRSRGLTGEELEHEIDILEEDVIAIMIDRFPQHHPLAVRRAMICWFDTSAIWQGLLARQRCWTVQA